MGLFSNIINGSSAAISGGASLIPGVSKGANQLFGEATGFGAFGTPNPNNVDPAAYAELYQQALNQINQTGMDPASQALRTGIQGAAQSQLDNLQNNAAGRKQTFMSDKSRGFNADITNMARAKGGTGTLDQAMRGGGGMYDSQARSISSGLNDLYSQATKDLGSLYGVQSGLYGQDLSKNEAAAGLTGNELASRRGTAAGNAANTFNAQQIGAGRRVGTMGGIIRGLSSMGGGGGGGF